MTLIYVIGALAIGFLFGTVVEAFIDSKQIVDLAEHNKKLKLENEQLRKEVKHEVIEIVDNRTKSDEVQFGGF